MCAFIVKYLLQNCWKTFVYKMPFSLAFINYIWWLGCELAVDHIVACFEWKSWHIRLKVTSQWSQSLTVPKFEHSGKRQFYVNNICFLLCLTLLVKNWLINLLCQRFIIILIYLCFSLSPICCNSYSQGSCSHPSSVDYPSLSLYNIIWSVSLLL